MDAARSAIRLGVKDVTITYRRTRQEMPAQNIEIEEAIEEGVNMQYLTAPLSIQKKGDYFQLDCIKMALGEPDKSGRRRPIPQDGSEFSLTASTIISAIGQAVDGQCLGEKNLIDKRGNVVIDPRLSKQRYPGYFRAATALPDRTLPSPRSARASGRRNRLISISGRVKLFRPPSLTPAQKEAGATCRPKPLKELNRPTSGSASANTCDAKK